MVFGLGALLGIGAILGNAAVGIWGQSQRSKENLHNRYYDIMDQTGLLRSEISTTGNTLKSKLRQQSAVSDLSPTGTENIDRWMAQKGGEITFNEGWKLAQTRGKSKTAKRYRKQGYDIMNSAYSNVPKTGGSAFPSLGKVQNTVVSGGGRGG